MSEETLEISFDEIEKEREKYLLVDTRDKVTVEYGMIPGERFLFRNRNWKNGQKN